MGKVGGASTIVPKCDRLLVSWMPDTGRVRQQVNCRQGNSPGGRREVSCLQRTWGAAGAAGVVG